MADSPELPDDPEAPEAPGLKRSIWTAIVVALVAVAVAVLLVVRHGGDLASVAELDRGDCVDASAFLAGEQPAVSGLSRADCDDPHDAEVLLVLDLDAEQASAYRPVVPDTVCVDALDDDAGDAVDGKRLLVAGLTDAKRPEEGDTLVCFGFAADGSRLDGRMLTR